MRRRHQPVVPARAPTGSRPWAGLAVAAELSWDGPAELPAAGGVLSAGNV